MEKKVPPMCCGESAEWVDNGFRCQYWFCRQCKQEPGATPAGGRKDVWVPHWVEHKIDPVLDECVLCKVPAYYIVNKTFVGVEQCPGHSRESVGHIFHGDPRCRLCGVANTDLHRYGNPPCACAPQPPVASGKLVPRQHIGSGLSLNPAVHQPVSSNQISNPPLQARPIYFAHCTRCGVSGGTFTPGTGPSHCRCKP